jgi:pimeloyl-ACP methyl ester carboxylesterase
VALDYAIRRPARVERLALRCPSGIGRQTWGVILYAVLNLPFGRRGRERALRYATGITPEPRVAEYMLTMSEHFNPRGQLPVFSDEQLRTLTLPMTVTVGGRDKLLDSGATVRRLEATVPHAVVTLLPDEGHLLPAQTEEILAFLRG